VYADVLIAGCTRYIVPVKPLAGRFTFTAILPSLGVSFVELTRQADSKSLKQALLNRTITFERVVLLQSDVNWLTEDSLECSH